jgi:hypothetical protein
LLFLTGSLAATSVGSVSSMVHLRRGVHDDINA